MMRAVLIIFSVLVLSCGGPSNSEQNEEPFIDLNRWMEQEMKSLDGQELLKSSYWNEIGPNDTSYIPDWQKELKAFGNIPLTPSSWRTDFTSDISRNDSIKVLTLLPKDDLNELRSARISVVNNEVRQIELEYQYENMLKRNRRSMRFTSGEGYEISGVQKTRFFPEENYRIIGKFEAAN